MPRYRECQVVEIIVTTTGQPMMFVCGEEGAAIGQFTNAAGIEFSVTVCEKHGPKGAGAKLSIVGALPIPPGMPPLKARD